MHILRVHAVYRNVVIHLSILLCLFLLPSPLAGTHHRSPPRDLSRFVQAHRYAELGKRLRNHNKAFTLLTHLAKKHHDPILTRTLKAASTILQLSRTQKQRLGMTEGELIQIALYMETAFAQIRKTHPYLPSQESGLARTIEYDPATGLRFIHLEHVRLVGRGSTKRVTKSLLYSTRKPQFVARCSAPQSLREEYALLKRLQGVYGIVNVMAFTEHDAHGQHYQTLFCELYRYGSLQKRLFTWLQKISLKEKIRLAYDMVSGLEGMHKLGIVHRDIKGENFLLTYHNHHYKAAIADLELARYTHEMEAAQSCMQVQWPFRPPEYYSLQHKMATTYLKGDIFAVGSILYALLYGKKPAWQKEGHIGRLESAPRESVYKIHHDVVCNQIQRRRQLLVEKRHLENTLSLREKFELLILHMVHEDSHMRPTSKRVRNTLRRLIHAKQKK